MKTRIIHTKIHEDDWFRTLSRNTRYLLQYLLTNPHINLCGMYQISNATLLFGTMFKQTELDKAKEELGCSGKVFFYKDWVYIKNAQKYGGYTGDKNKIAIENELKSVPDDIKNCFLEGKCDGVLIGYTYPSDTTINHKSETINKKSEEGGVGETKFTIPEEKLNELESDEEFKEIEVRAEYKKAMDYLSETGGKRKDGKQVKDRVAFFRNWLRRPWVKKKPIKPLGLPPQKPYDPDRAKRNQAALSKVRQNLSTKLTI